ncbi:hypothetical protein CH282_16065 [Rhodococcus sp. 06-418-1B]|nr:hypothetical protein [Rhodococcus sp. 06-418-1B]OZC83465.1 hypothetical protein CH282_16065 [Rhodococcus sp. 06-418-1B]
MTSFEFLGQQLQVIASAFRDDEYGMDSSPPFRPRSRAWTEHQAERRFTGVWSRQPLINAYHEAVGYFFRAEDHLRGAGILVGGDNSVIYSPVSLGRTVLSACGMAYWLMDPDIDVGERIRRRLAVELDTLDQRAELADSNSVYTEDLSKQISNIGEAAEVLGVDFRVDKLRWGGVRHRLGLRVPSETAIAQAIVDDPEDEQTFGRFAYKWYSAVVHANPNSAALTNMTQTGPSIEGVQTVSASISLPKMAQNMLTAGLVYYKAGVRLHDHFGLRTQDSDVVARNALSKISAIAQSTSTPL